MIKVDRADPRPEAQRPAVLDLGDVTSPAYRERARAINYYHPPDPNIPPDPDKPAKKPAYSVYSRAEVKAALFNLFRDKCAYCETRITGNQTGDVEHLRPKGSIKNPGRKALSPGYYWLAAEWNNLLLSCQSCNTARKEPELQADGTWAIAKDATGKKDQYPLLSPGQHVSRWDGNLDDEEDFRLLLDPCRDDPEEYLVYDQDGSILPRDTFYDENGDALPDDGDEARLKRERARESIRVFDLKRHGLKTRRWEHYLDMLDRWKNVQEIAEFIQDYETAAPDVKAYLQSKKDKMRKHIERNGDRLIACIDGDQVFAGFCRQVLAGLAEEVKALKQRFEEIYGA